MNWISSFILKKVCSSKGTVTRMERHITDWENILAKHISDEGLGSEYIKVTQNL